MLLRIAAFAVFAIAPCAHAQAWLPDAVPTASNEPLTLDDAFERVARSHPDLRLFGPRGEALLAERDFATLRPPFRAILDIENALGSGEGGAGCGGVGGLGVVHPGDLVDAGHQFSAVAADAVRAQAVAHGRLLDTVGAGQCRGGQGIQHDVRAGAVGAEAECGHFVAEEAPDAVLAALEPFLAQV